VAATIALLAFYGLVFVNPDSSLNPFPPARPTEVAVVEVPTPTLPPTWTPTVTATPTLRPTATPTVTSTSTATPTPVDTATPTATPTVTPTPAPTPTPKPPLYSWVRMEAGADCTWTGVFGVIWGPTDLPLEGVQIHLWNNEGIDVLSAPSDVDGNYAIQVAGEPVSGHWFVEVVEAGVPQSAILEFETSRGCENGLQKYRIDWKRAE